ncbi:tetrahydrofolate dehydrogenase/cyclohydrolase catalytic domain-containing protein [Clostridium sp. AM58-1XD]|uniref:tetrahydrofolate dehydrogenase/cyclohydrolase catalytic domain-containing protein n=1 Tax=Clostridium sp. AM58-1XD TaxID=2292307 RepID=UPI0026D29F3F
MIILRGADVAAKIKEEIDEGIRKLDGCIPKLAIVRVGSRPDDVSYERGALKKMEKLGLRAEAYAFPEDISDEEFKKEFSRINGDSAVDGILLLRPLPRQIREKDIEKMILPEKDLDGISPENIAKVFAGDRGGFAPCTAEAVIEVLKANDILQKERG